MPSSPPLNARSSLSGTERSPAPLPRRVSCGALPLLMPDFAPLGDLAADLLHRTQAEVVIESSMHVTGFQARECAMQYGFHNMEDAPVLRSISDASMNPFSSLDDLKLSADEESVSGVAACLAAPAEYEEAEVEGTMQHLRSNSAANATRMGMRLSIAEQQERVAEMLVKLRRQRRRSFNRNSPSADDALPCTDSSTKGAECEGHGAWQPDEVEVQADAAPVHADSEVLPPKAPRRPPLAPRAAMKA